MSLLLTTSTVWYEGVSGKVKAASDQLLAATAVGHPAVATEELAELRSASVQATAELLPSWAWVVLFCVRTGLHLAPELLLNGAICRQQQMSASQALQDFEVNAVLCEALVASCTWVAVDRRHLQATGDVSS